MEKTELLNSFIDFLKNKLSTELYSAVLFGSAAENRIRANSDINLLVVLNSSSLATLDKIKSEYRDHHNLIHLSCLFIERSELDQVCQTFPLKFYDISKRNQIVAGANIIPEIKIDPANLKFQLKQSLMNLTMRLRERYTFVSLREEQLVHIMNEFSGPLRTNAFSLVSLQGESAKNPKEALNIFLKKYFPDRAEQLSETISTIRESSTLSKNQIEPTYQAYLEILKKMQNVLGT
tara:strand:+ start:86608 stop:87312 length:705 start_codon:yes stop_codon:yes gene_type:complete